MDPPQWRQRSAPAERRCEKGHKSNYLENELERHVTRWQLRQRVQYQFDH